jgi:hypothetical protein
MNGGDRGNRRTASLVLITLSFGFLLLPHFNDPTTLRSLSGSHYPFCGVVTSHGTSAMETADLVVADARGPWSCSSPPRCQRQPKIAPWESFARTCMRAYLRNRLRGTIERGNAAGF